MMKDYQKILFLVLTLFLLSGLIYIFQYDTENQVVYGTVQTYFKLHGSENIL